MGEGLGFLIGSPLCRGNSSLCCVRLFFIPVGFALCFSVLFRHGYSVIFLVYINTLHVLFFFFQFFGLSIHWITEVLCELVSCDNFPEEKDHLL